MVTDLLEGPTRSSSDDSSAMRRVATFQSERKFARTLLKERLRTDRNQVPFSLLVLQVRRQHQTDTARHRLALALGKEMTDLDVIGWLDRRRLALLMPCTDAHAAVQRAHRIHGRLGRHQQRFRTQILSYDGGPTDETPYETDPPDPETTPAPPEVTSHFFRRQPLWKRIVDVLGATCGIIALSPVLVGMACVVKLASPGPVLFKQWRVGAKGQLFRIWKFRTMHVDHDASVHQVYVAQQIAANGTLSKLDGEQPLIPGGRMLRESGIDELPQLFNVLWGDMSLVGPRPDVATFASYKPWQRRRFDVLPGITGLWQVNGKNETTFEEMMRYDAEYVDKRSARLDFRILLRTVPTVLRPFYARDEHPCRSARKQT